jgi:hypothetical protein
MSVRSIFRVWALIFASLFISFINAEAQVVKVDTLTHWKKTFEGGINVNQAAFSSNWKGGGVNSFGFNGRMNYKAEYKKDKNTWYNEFGFLFGMVNNQGQGYRKTLDRIYLESKYGYELNSKWSLTSSLNFLSQFAKGYKYETVNGIETGTLISDFLAPAFITSAWGFEYHPVDYFKLRFSPFSPRVTIVADNNGRFDVVDLVKPYGVMVGESTRFEWLAFQMQADFNKDIAKNLNLNFRYVMFANYETLELKTIDHRVDLLLTAKVNKFMNVSLGGIMIYDFDQDSGAQLSQAFSLGFAYTFQNYEPKK